MTQDKEKITYFVYARKSSESEDKQVQSIEDQTENLQKLSTNLGLNTKTIFTEAKSAKKPNNRPAFDEMIKRIENGEANGILCWALNRLTRNPIDSGKIGWLLQQGIIKSIRTIEKEYLPSDNVLLFSVETGQANQYILDLSRDTKRGILKRVNAGWQNGVPPLGYLNERENKTIIKDPERFGLVRKMWDLMLTGNYTQRKILNIANNEWGFRTRKFKRMGSNPLSYSGIYDVFKNKFYAGIARNKGIEYVGKHEPMITLEEYDRVQKLLGRKGIIRPISKEFAFTGLIRCKECGCLYTAEIKNKLLQTTKEIKQYTYYHCTRKTRRVNCTQKSGMTEGNLELAIEKDIDRLTILPEFLNWALEDLNKKNDVEIEDRSKIYEMQHQNLVKAQNELDELTKMRYRQLIDDETFIKEKDELTNKISQMKTSLRGTEARAENWLELTEKTFNFATYAHKAFLKAKLEKRLELKREILSGLGKIITITDKKLSIELNDWFIPIENDYKALEQEYLRLELDKTPINKAKTEALTSVHTGWLLGSGSNRRPTG